MQGNRLIYGAATVLGCCSALLFMSMTHQTAEARPYMRDLQVQTPMRARPIAIVTPDAPNHELAEMVDADRRDSLALSGHVLNSKSASDKVAARCQEVREVYRRNGLTTGEDYRIAAELLLKSPTLEDVKLGHDFAIAALALGNRQAAATAASATDVLMTRLGQPQRFGTLLAKGGRAVAPDVRNSLLQCLSLPSKPSKPKSAVAIRAGQGPKMVQHLVASSPL